MTRLRLNNSLEGRGCSLESQTLVAKPVSKNLHTCIDSFCVRIRDAIELDSWTESELFQS